MKTISVTICKTKGPLKWRPVPQGHGEIKGGELIRWLKAQGAKPVEPAMKRRLMAVGHWGMPNE
jgi:hypothetical protein